MHDCPPLDSLRHFGDESDPTLGDLLEHVERCERCRGLLDEMIRDGSRSSSRTDEIPVTPVLPGLSDLEEIGRGGSARVYRAWNARLESWQAVKVLASGSPGSRPRWDRTLREARAAARVHHEGILRVFDVGLAGDLPYIVMEFAAGGTLADRLEAEGPITAEVAAGVGLRLAETLSAIHAEGLVHRDLKPSNVMLRERPGTPLERCRPLIGDFGLARDMDVRGSTDGWLAFGTPGYMAPEQAPGSADPVAARTDVYSLGATLFRMVAGRPPHVGPTPEAALLSTIESEAPPAGRFAPGLPWALESIIATCLRHRPDQRYASAADVADQLRRFLAEPARSSSRRPTRAIVAPGRVARIVATSLVAALATWAGVAPRRPSQPAAKPASAAGLTDQEVAVGLREVERIIDDVYRIPERSPRELISAVEQAREGLEEARILRTARPRSRGATFAHFRLAHGLGQLEKRSGDDGAALRLDAEALETAEASLACRPGDVEVVAWAAEILRVHAFELLRARRQYEALRALGRRVDLLNSLPSTPDRPAEILDSHIWMGVTLKSIGLTDEGHAKLTECLQAAEDAIRLRPDSSRFWGQKASILTHLGRSRATVEALRRCVGLDPTNEERARTLARALFAMARWTASAESQPGLLDEVQSLVDSREGSVGRRRDDSRHPLTMEEAARWDKIRTALKDERARIRVAVAFEPSLIASINAESGRPGGSPDGGRLADMADEIAIEHTAAKQSRTWVRPLQEHHAASSAGALEWGVALIASGDPGRGRVLISQGLAYASAVRRIDGELPRAERLSELAIETFRLAPPPVVEDDEQLAVRIHPQIWTLAAKVRWEKGDFPRAREAIEQGVGAAEALNASPFDDGSGPVALDDALRRLARFECEAGRFHESDEALDRCLRLWPSGSTQADRVRKHKSEVAAERKARSGRDVASAAR